MSISKEYFREQVSRLERQFNAGKQLDPLVQKEYFMMMNLFKKGDLIEAVDEVIQTHRPYPGHLFPSISVILDALDTVMKSKAPADDDQPGLGFCQQCHNTGIYLVKNDGYFCDCIKGRQKEITFLFWPNKKRIAAEKEKIKAAAPPHQGHKERSPAGFWTDTQEEHDRWMTAKAKNVKILQW